jgi:hypothetical protein
MKLSIRYRMRRDFTLTAAAVLVAGLIGCASHHEEGVTSDMHSQWTTVNADTAKTTEAAKTVLMDENLTNVDAHSTNVDGVATAKKADGTDVTVNIKKLDSGGSQVSVNVGMIGDPALGADIAKKVKTRAESGM